MLKDKLKGTIISQGFTLSQVNSELNKIHSTNYSLQNFSNRLRRGTLAYDEVEEILNIIGYEIEWKLKNL